MMIVIKIFLSIYYVPDIVVRALCILTHGAIIMPISQMKKPKQRTTEHLVQDHEACKWHSWDPKSGHVTPAVRFFISMPDAGRLHILYPGSAWDRPSDELITQSSLLYDTVRVCSVSSEDEPFVDGTS